MTPETLSNIVAGPNKFDLMLALFDSIEPRRFVEFEFQTTPRINIKAKFWVSKVQRDGLSGESWNFEGCRSFDNFLTNKDVKGNYNTKSRTGIFGYI